MSAGLVGIDKEPTYQVNEFVDELVSRARLVLRDMGRELESMLKNIVQAMDTFKEAHLLITLRDVRFDETSWLKESGQLMFKLALGAAPPDPDMFQHVVVDSWVAEVVGRAVPPEFVRECALLLRALVMQFAMLGKMGFDLTTITFDRPTWVSDRMLITVRSNGKPMLPRDAGAY